MKGLGLISTGIAAAMCFAASAVAQLDPIVIKVLSSDWLYSFLLYLTSFLSNLSGLQILLQDKWH